MLISIITIKVYINLIRNIIASIQDFEDRQIGMN